MESIFLRLYYYSYRNPCEMLYSNATPSTQHENHFRGTQRFLPEIVLRSQVQTRFVGLSGGGAHSIKMRRKSDWWSTAIGWFILCVGGSRVSGFWIVATALHILTPNCLLPRRARHKVKGPTDALIYARTKWKTISHEFMWGNRASSMEFLPKHSRTSQLSTR